MVEKLTKSKFRTGCCSVKTLGDFLEVLTRINPHDKFIGEMMY